LPRWAFADARHSRVLLAGIQWLDSHELPIVTLDARQKHSGMTY
jgi:hypothetical protein